MPRRHRGVITNIYRDGVPGDDSGLPQVLATIQGVGAQVPATYYGEPPPPLSTCWFSGGPVWHCDGVARGDVTPVLREHFVEVPTLTSTADMPCDTYWLASLTAGSIQQIGGSYADTYGAALIATGTLLNAVVYVRKSDDAITLPAAPAALWLTTRWAQTTSTAARSVELGFIDTSSFTDAAYARWISTNTVLDFVTIAAGSPSATNSATAPVANTFNTVDLALVAGTFLAGWIDGDGPYVVETNVPTAPVSVATRIVNLTAGTSRQHTIDNIDVTHVGYVTNPNDL